jgi:hypothetical protein
VQGDGKGDRTRTAACIDAEALAAWAEGGLSKAESAAVEVHLADCDRCTAMLATFVRTIPEPPAAESLWQRWHLRWLVPVATAATVAALWVLIPTPDQRQTAMLDSAPTAAPGAAASSSPEPAPPVETKEQEFNAAVDSSKRADTFARGADTPQAPVPQQPSDERRQEDAKAERREAPNQPITVAPPPPRETDRAQTRDADAQSAERFASPVPSASAPAAASAAPQTTNTEAERSRLAAAAPRAATSSVLEVISPDAKTRWRVIGAGQVERSTTGGAQWERATLPESATLTGASSPSPSVCWLVGRSGAMYVTTDGLRFTRVPFPDRTDFVSIQATDARRATVITIDGRTMRTEDQGASWTRIAP